MAKSPRGRGATGWLNLVDHSIDVVAVVDALLHLPTIRTLLGGLAERRLDEVDIARLGYIVGLHDAGKVNHGFQRRLRGEQPDAGHIGPPWGIVGRSHFSTAHRSLRRAFRREAGVPRQWFADGEAEREFWGVILAHHGSLPEPRPPEAPLWSARGGYDPWSALADLARVLRGVLPEAFTEDHPALPTARRFQHALAGYVTLADWIGSNQAVFRSPDTGAPTGQERIAWARDQASDFLRSQGIDPKDGRSAAARVAFGFGDLFPGLAPRPAQSALLASPLPDGGQVTVLEAETGSGKTEAALIHYLRLFRAEAVDGLYFALPTRAAAAQLHGRVQEIIRRWLGDAAPPVGLAVPGYLRVDDAEGQRLPQEHGVRWPDEAQGRSWAVENTKRYLSGAVMVGTIDQVLMGGLRVKHAPFRSGPMLRLLLCVDEVHASDAYMTQLLRNVLQQHRVAGGHALLMSATLGSLARLRLLNERVEYHEAPDAESAARLAYPSIQRSGEELEGLQVPPRRQKQVTIELVDPETDLLDRLAAAARSGAVVLFVRNRVDDAVEMVRQLERIGAPLLRCHGVAAPHHGRFAPEDRQLLDEALEGAFPARGERDGVIAVTTQTAEQSLDIDADWLVTDIAPGDVLLQRVGRLHRHERDRPGGYADAHVTVLAPSAGQLASRLDPRTGMPRGRAMLGLGRVYENIVGVLATRAWLDEHGEMHIPADNRAIVEAATHPEALVRTAERLGDPWPGHLQSVEGLIAALSGAAQAVVIDWEQPLIDNPPVTDPRASTRLGLDDRRVEFSEPQRGPFGEPVRVVNIPGWMAPDDVPEDDDAVAADVVVKDGEIRFRWLSKEYRYSRFGLEPAS